MELDKAIQLTSNNVPIPDAKALAALRMDKSRLHYKDLPQARRLEWLSAQVLLMYFKKHLRPDDVRIGYDARFLDEMIMDDKYISDYTSAEITEAFRRGMMGDYGEYFGLTAENLFKFLRGFLMSEKKQAATRLVIQARKEEREKAQAELNRLLFDKGKAITDKFRVNK